MTEQLTHWKKNIDPRYISGEDLKYNLHGLFDNTIVRILEHKDVPTFDQKKQEEVLKTGLVLADMNGNILPKMLLLNVENGKVLKGIFKSIFVEDWIRQNIPFVIYAKPDKRHDWVARVKAYYAPAQQAQPQQPVVTPEQIIDACLNIEASESFEQLKTIYTSLDKIVRMHPEVIAAKDKRKGELES